MSTQRPRCSLQHTQQSWFSSHPARKAGPSGPVTALRIYLPIFTSSTHVPCRFFWKKTRVYGQGRMQPCSISSLSSEKWRIRASGCSRTALCLSVHPSRAIPGICMIYETFPFPVCSGVRIHSGSSLHLQSKVNNF